MKNYDTPLFGSNKRPSDKEGIPMNVNLKPHCLESFMKIGKYIQDFEVVESTGLRNEQP